MPKLPIDYKNIENGTCDDKRQTFKHPSTQNSVIKKLREIHSLDRRKSQTSNLEDHNSTAATQYVPKASIAEKEISDLEENHKQKIETTKNEPVFPTNQVTFSATLSASAGIRDLATVNQSRAETSHNSHNKRIDHQLYKINTPNSTLIKEEKNQEDSSKEQIIVTSTSNVTNP
jgi:hypothetical protein